MPSPRAALRAIAAATAVGGFLADWNRTHLFNPQWPPHARFHDAVSITAGALLGSGGLYLLRDSANEREVAIGTALPAIFWVSQGSAFLYPGTAGLEAEFPQYVPRVRGVWINERFASTTMLAAAAVAYVAERRAVSRDRP